MILKNKNSLIRTQIDATSCDCLSLDSLAVEATDLVSFHYREIEENDGYPRPADVPTRLFDLRQTRFRLMTNEDLHPLSEVRTNFNEWMRASGRFCQPKTVYRPVLLPLRGFKSIACNFFDDVNGAEYYETHEFDEATTNPVLQDIYRFRLKEQLSAEIAFERMKFQGITLGYFTPPLIENSSGRTRTLIGHDQHNAWFVDFEWNRIQNAGGLTRCAAENGTELLNEYRSYVGTLKKGLKKFKERARLDNHRFWLDYQEEPRRYVTLLKMYSEFLNALFCLANNAVEMCMIRMCRMQEDLFSCVEACLDR